MEDVFNALTEAELEGEEFEEEKSSSHSDEPLKAMMNTNRNPQRLRRVKKYDEGERGKTSTDTKRDKATARFNEPNSNEENANGAQSS